MKYEYHGDFARLDPPGYALRWLRGFDRILELGPAGGALTEQLAMSGSSVVTVEYDASFVPVLDEVADVVLERDLDVVTRDELAKHGPFDAVVATDVLEHLRDPARLLHVIAQLLRDDGVLVVSLPNVTHGDVRLALLSGEFNSTNEGLLDSTHLRFFTRETAEALITDPGFEIVELERTWQGIGTTEQAKFCDPKYFDLRESLVNEPEAETYQFIFRAVKRGKPIVKAIQEAAEAHKALRAAEDRIAQLSAEVDGLRAALAALESDHSAMNAQRHAIDVERARLADRVKVLEAGIEAVGHSGTFKFAALISKLRHGADAGTDVHTALYSLLDRQ